MDVDFQRPFILDGMDTPQPAGTYKVDTEEECLDSVLFPAWRRLATSIRIVRSGCTEYVPISPKQLHEALIRDGAQWDSPLRPPSVASKAQRDGTRAMRHLPRNT